MKTTQSERKNGKMKTIEVNTYTAQELKEHNPEAFEKAFERYKESQYSFGLNWGDEMFESLKALVELGGYKLKDYSLGDSSCRGNHITISERDCDDLSGRRAFAWLENNILAKLRDKNGELDAGKLTGYCFDHNLVEHLQESIKDGNSVKESLESLVDPYVKQVDAEWEDQLSEERFIDESDANEIQFLEDGRKI